MSTTRVIDLSKHNGSVDFTKVKAAGVSGVILRAGYGKLASQEDPTFASNYVAAKAAGLNVGAYWYSYAKTASEAKEEASACLSVINGKCFEMPIYFDIEDKTQVSLGKSVCTAITIAFVSALESAGYFVGVYSYDSFFASNLDTSIQTRYSCWVARVENVKPTSCKTYGMWQYTWKGNINGVSGDCDVSYCYKDFPTTIKSKRLNGYTQTLYDVTATRSGVTDSELSELTTLLTSKGFAVSKKASN